MFKIWSKMLECNSFLFIQFSLLFIVIITNLMIDCSFLVKAQWIFLFRKIFNEFLKMKLISINSFFFIFESSQRFRDCIDVENVMIDW